MAFGKKGQLRQFMVPMVDSTDFASVESAITESDFNSGATVKFYGCDNGTSAAFTSGTVSKTGRLVRSGVFQIVLKGTENNYDNMQVRINKTGCAEQIISWENVDNDDSDIMSALTVIQSMASDAASAAQQGNSRVLLNQSRISDAYSMLSDFYSDFQSRVPKAVATNSQLSDLHSDLRSYLVANSAVLSDVYSALSDMQSDFQSRVPKRVATDSQLSDLHSDLRSYLVGLSSMESDLYSQLSDFRSDLASLVTTTGVGLNASTMSDLRSAISAGAGATVTASDISDIASAVRAILISDLSDIHSAATAGASRALLNQSRISDVYSMLSDLQSDFQSRVPKAVATNSQLSDLHSDLRSVLIVMSGIQSDIYSAIAAGVEIGASSLSDIRSAVAATELDASDLSDIASAVWARLGSDPTTVPAVTATMGAKIDWLTALSRNKLTQTATVQSLRNDADAADIASAAVADDGTTYTRSEWS